MYTFEFNEKENNNHAHKQTNKQENRISFVLNITLVKSVIFW